MENTSPRSVANSSGTMKLPMVSAIQKGETCMILINKCDKQIEKDAKKWKIATFTPRLGQWWMDDTNDDDEEEEAAGEWMSQKVFQWIRWSLALFLCFCLRNKNFR